MKNAGELLTDEKKYQSMIKHLSPYGDGHAAEKIFSVINHYTNRDIAK